MTTIEYASTVEQLLGVDSAALDNLVPDTRQSGFTRNQAQIVDPLLARQLQEATAELAAEFVGTRLASQAPCASQAADAACARSFYDSFLPRAYRRPLENGELDAVMTVYDAGAASTGFDGGMTVSLAAVLQSAAFIYHTELGTASSPGQATELTAHETANALSFLLTGGPPDEALKQSADAGTLASSAGREAEARRLLATEAARPQLVRLIEEWLGIDDIVDIGKDKQQFPEYEQLRPAMLEETAAFVNDVVFNESGSLTTLFAADFTLVGREMAQFYGLPDPGTQGPSRVSLQSTTRRGILNHASFLARYATEVHSAPVHRGVAVGKRVMCVDPGDPTGLNIDIVPPQPQPGQTTRERFAQHTIDPACAGCHSGIDGIGFTFEGFDAIGAARDQENGKPVDTATELGAVWAAGLDQDTFADSADLAATLSRSESVKRCFTRHLGRYAGAATNTASENTFISQWEQMEAQSKDSIQEILIAYVASDVFIARAAQREGGTL